MKIHVLSDEVVNKISAGEVVERPAAVVRELVDNALDAGASDVLVELEEGGQNLIRVCDNGCGMSRGDLLLAFQRHATSKISKAEDLLSIATMGFRGEALPSIAAVSKVKVVSRDATSDLASQLVMEGGKILNVTEAAAACGTLFEVKQLFYNTPARKKFLKSAKSEVSKIKTWLAHSSLAYPTVRYRLVSDGKELLNLPKVQSTLERARAQFKGTTIPFSCQVSGMQLEGLIAHPSMAHYDTAAFILLVNNRLINDRMLLRAVKEGFDSTLKDREFPVGFLHWKLSAEDVDVNVHPQKSEVRFRNSGLLFGFTRDAVLKAVKSFASPNDGISNAPTITSTLKLQARNPIPYSPSSTAQISINSFLQGSAAVNLDTNLVYQSTPQTKSIESYIKFSDLKYLAQILDCYLVCQHHENLYLVDMHAAHERYNYNLIRNSFKTKQVVSQSLLIPLSIELSADGLIHCMERLELYQKFGFDWDELGETTLVLRAVPSFFNNANCSQMIKDLAVLCEDHSPESSFEKEVDHIAARLACHASIRSGRKLAEPEVYALFADLDRTEFAAACPHGRPVVVRFSRAEIEAWFGRDS